VSVYIDENTGAVELYGSEKPKPAQDSQQKQVRDAILARLAELGEFTTGEDSLVFEGSSFVLPESMRGDIKGAIKFLRDYEQQQETHFAFTKEFLYRPWDGANAFQNAMKRVFGSTGVGGAIKTMFGEIPPQYHTINVGPNEQIQVPFGRVMFSPLEADFYLQSTYHREYGLVFAIQVDAPRKNRAHIDAFFQVVEDELRNNSIYRGKAITGGAEPSFRDTSAIDPNEVVYSPDVLVQLETNMWSLLRHTNQMRKSGIPLKRAVLVEGPYGTGKTLAGQLTAREAVQNGWTFILCRSGKDNLDEVLQTAQLYSPAVVWYEDIDVVAQGHSDEQIAKLLDSLDGITAKGTEILAGFTSNHVDKIQKGVLRPGRLDAVIHVEGIDADGIKKLIRVNIPDHLLSNVDFAKVAESFAGFLPAFAKEAISRAKVYSISRNHGIPDVITTDDLVNAANGLRPQLELMNRAQEGVRKSTLEQSFREIIESTVETAVDGMGVVDLDGDTMYSLSRDCDE
jgi:hypothetical protein